MYQVKTSSTNITFGREGFEETGQGLVGTLVTKLLQDKIDPNRKTGQGGADATVQGAVYGSLAAGAMYKPQV
jgi:hypothetical protein